MSLRYIPAAGFLVLTLCPGVRAYQGRILVAICHNPDAGDAWEWAESPDFPERETSLAYRIGMTSTGCHSEGRSWPRRISREQLEKRRRLAMLRELLMRNPD